MKINISQGKLKNNKGLSEVVAVVIMILLVIVAAAIIWATINNLIEKKTEGVKSCFDVGFSEKVFFNGDYTCYDSTTKEVQFSVGIGDVEIEKIIVTISAGGSSKSFEITSEAGTQTDLLKYSDRTTGAVMPGKNAGLTYIATGIEEIPDWIKIAPFVGEKQCDPTDTIYELEDCSLFS